MNKKKIQKGQQRKATLRKFYCCLLRNQSRQSRSWVCSQDKVVWLNVNLMTILVSLKTRTVVVTGRQVWMNIELSKNILITETVTLVELSMDNHVHFGLFELTKEGACEHIAGGLVGWIWRWVLVDVVISGRLPINLKRRTYLRHCHKTTFNHKIMYNQTLIF